MLNTTETITTFLESILDSVHPLMAEGLHLAAVPNWYNVSLFGAMRAREDGRDEGIVTRLNRYSFIVPLEEDGDQELIYTVRPDERIVLQRHWITKDPQAYRNAHQRALDYWNANPDPNRFAAALEKAVLNSSKEPKAALMASASSPVGRPPPFGDITSQNKQWL